MRKRELGKILVIDIEATCWEDYKNPPVIPGTNKRQRSEMIEAGLAVLNIQKGIIETNISLYVEPEYSKVSEYCTNLTGITTDTLQGAPKFRDVCQTLRTEFQSKNRIWASWGDYDRNQFGRDCHNKSVKYPFGPTHINVKSFFSLYWGYDRYYNMDEALKLRGLALEGRHHSGKDDSFNIAKLLWEILKNGRGENAR